MKVAKTVVCQVVRMFPDKQMDIDYAIGRDVQRMHIFNDRLIVRLRDTYFSMSWLSDLRDRSCNFELRFTANKYDRYTVWLVDRKYKKRFQVDDMWGDATTCENPVTKELYRLNGWRCSKLE
jgi:hypothetical protein